MGLKERRAFRKERRKKIQELIELGSNLKNLPTVVKAGDYQKVFAEVWPFFREAFAFVKLLKVTGPKVDANMDELIKLGDAIVTTNSKEAQTQFQLKIMVVWGPIRTILGIVIAFSPPKVDTVLDRIIEVGDWITNTTDEENTPLTA